MDNGKMIIIPEPHISGSNIEGRTDYVGEIKGYMGRVDAIVRSNESIRYLTFPGDIFNRGFKSIDEYIYWIDWFNNISLVLQKRGGCILSAVGNHELSFSRNNPFWHLTSREDKGYSTLIEWEKRVTNPKAPKSTIHVPDQIVIGDVAIFFCHYEAIEECRVNVRAHIAKYGDSMKRVCICHNSIISNVIANVLKENYGRDPMTHIIQHEQIESLDFFHNFDLVFNGHMHKAYSTFTLTDDNTGHTTKLYYLASLGRTNSEEVNDNDLTRILPVLNLDTFELTCETIELLNRESALVPTYDVDKEVKKNVERVYNEVCERVIDIGNPIVELKKAIEDVDMLLALEGAISGVKPNKLLELERDSGLYFK